MKLNYIILILMAMILLSGCISRENIQALEKYGETSVPTVTPAPVIITESEPYNMFLDIDYIDNIGLMRWNESMQRQYLSILSLPRPKERTIILRIDDVQGYAWNDILIDMTNEILQRNMSVVLGVIPFAQIENDKKIYNYMLSIKDNPHVEIAQHGTYHTQSESFNLTEDETYKLAKIGKDKLYDILKINPVTFIPPKNEYNDNSTIALSRLGFKYLSAGNQYWDNLYDTHVYRVGYSTATKYGNKGTITPDTQVISECKASLDATNFCLVLFTPQDYDNRGLDSCKNRLDGLSKLDATTKTFGSK